MTPAQPTRTVCQRWLAARITFASTAILWVILVDPSAIAPTLLTFPLAFAAALDRARSRAWLDSHTFVLSALLLTLPTTLLAIVGAAALPNAALALFASGPTPPISPLARAILAATATALTLALLSTPAQAYAPAVALAAFASIRPLAALGEVFRALGLHRGPVDPLLAWRPLTSPHGGRA